MNRTAAGQPSPRRHPLGSAGARRRSRPGGRPASGRRPRRSARLRPPRFFSFFILHSSFFLPPSWLKPLPDKPGCFRTDGVGKDRDVDFVPFYRLHRRTYAIYWDLFTPQEWDQRAGELAAERERQRKLEAATVGFAQPGEMQAERDANMQGEDTEPLRLQGRAGRRGAKWFSFDLPGRSRPSHGASRHLQP